MKDQNKLYANQNKLNPYMIPDYSRKNVQLITPQGSHTTFVDHTFKKDQKNSYNKESQFNYKLRQIPQSKDTHRTIRRNLTSAQKSINRIPQLNLNPVVNYQENSIHQNYTININN